MNINQKGFGLVEALLIIILVGILGLTGWFVWQTKNKTNNSYNSAGSLSSVTQKQTITNFDECQNSAGSTIEQTYPEICVTKDGKKFTQASPTSSASNISYSHGIPVPASSQARAKAAGYYCPSWDAKPGVMTPYFCVTLDNQP